MGLKISNVDFFKEKPDKASPEEKSQPVKEQAAEAAAPKAVTAKFSPGVTGAVKNCIAALKSSGMQNLAVEVEKIYRSASHERFTIGVVGEFNRGKSTFINRFLNREVLPVGDLPTTAVQTRVRYSPNEMLVAFNEKNQKVVERPLSQEVWEGLTANHFGGKDFEGTAFVGINDQWLKDSCVEMMDTPGAGDLSEARAKVIGDALLGCDGAIITVNAVAALSMSEKLFIEERLIARKIPFLMMIVTKLDMVPLRERVDVLRYIQSKLKGWNMDIPVYVPYPVELTSSSYDDCIGMDKIRTEIENWIRHPERLGVTEEWVKEKTISIMDQAIDSLTEQKLLLDAANDDKKAELIAKKKAQLLKAKLEWSQLKLSMQKRCTECYNFLLKKVDEYAESITERLQYEAGHAGSPQKWWQEDYPYRLKIELTNMAAGVENAVSHKVSDDMRWYSASIEKTFSSNILYQRETISEKGMFGDFTTGRDLKFENMDRKRNLFKIGAAVLSVSGVVLFSAMGFLPIFATMGIGTTTGIISDKVFKDKIEKQRTTMKEEIARCVPDFIQDSMAESESRLNTVYNDIMNEAEKSEQMWMEAQEAAIAAVAVPKNTDQYELLCRQLALMEREKDSVINLL